MTIKLQEGCYGATVSVNGTDLFQHTQDSIEVNSEVQAQAIKYIIAKLKDDPSLITGVVNELITRGGEYEDKGYCEQCCTNEEQWSEEFEVTPKIVNETSTLGQRMFDNNFDCWAAMGENSSGELTDTMAMTQPKFSQLMEAILPNTQSLRLLLSRDIKRRNFRIHSNNSDSDNIRFDSAWKMGWHSAINHIIGKLNNG